MKAALPSVKPPRRTPPECPLEKAKHSTGGPSTQHRTPAGASDQAPSNLNKHTAAPLTSRRSSRADGAASAPPTAPPKTRPTGAASRRCVPRSPAAWPPPSRARAQSATRAARRPPQTAARWPTWIRVGSSPLPAALALRWRGETAPAGGAGTSSWRRVAAAQPPQPPRGVGRGAAPAATRRCVDGDSGARGYKAPDGRRSTGEGGGVRRYARGGGRRLHDGGRGARHRLDCRRHRLACQRAHEVKIWAHLDRFRNTRCVLSSVGDTLYRQYPVVCFSVLRHPAIKQGGSRSLRRHQRAAADDRAERTHLIGPIQQTTGSSRRQRIYCMKHKVGYKVHKGAM